MIDRIIAGIIENWFLVGLSFFLLVAGTITAYRKFGIKRVLLGKKNDQRELIYREDDGSIIWRPTLKTWQIILTGGMNLLTVFLLIMLLALSFIYQHDIQASRDNDELLCKTFGTVNPSQEQLEDFYGIDNNEDINFSEIKLGVIDERRGTGNNRST